MHHVKNDKIFPDPEAIYYNTNYGLKAVKGTVSVISNDPP